MKSLNSVQLIGNIGNDPEFSENQGKMVSKLSMATTDKWLDKVTAETRVITEWHKLVFFNKLAEIAKDYLKKGARIFVSGKLRTSEWKNKNGETRHTTEVIVDELIMLDSKQP